jgi:acyl dehydratase
MVQGSMMRHSSKKYFEDISIGDCAESGEQVVDREEMLDFARRYDPQYFHTDPEAAKASVFGEVVASGLFTAVLWRRLDHEISGDIAWICGVAWKDTRWPKAVRAGDRLRAKWECVAKRESSSDPRRGVIEMDYRLTDQSGDTVFSCRSVNLIERRR